MSRTMTRTLVGIMTLGTLAIIAFGLFFPKQLPTSSQPTSSRIVGFQVGNIAPNFTLLALDGKRVSLNDYKGKAVMVNFWYSTCDGCRAELPALQKFYAAQQASHKNSVILGVDVADDVATAKQFVLQHGLTYPIVLDQNFSVGSKYNVSGTPISYFIHPDGVIGAIAYGPVDEAALQQDFMRVQ